MFLKPASLIALASALSVGIVEMAVTQNYEQLFKRCYTESLPDQVIASCSAIISRGLEDKEDLATAYKNRGNAYDDNGDYARALQDYDEALRINPADADAFNSRGTTYTAIGRHERAILDFDEAVRLNPSSPMAFGNRCFAKAVLDRLEPALADCSKALLLRPHDPGAFRSRAFVYLKLRRYEAAISDYDAVLRTTREDPHALFGRGVAKHMKGDWRGGDSDIVAALALKPDIADFMDTLGIRVQNLRKTG